MPVPEEQLPVLLPENVEITLAGGSPLGRVPEFANATCPKCGGHGTARNRHHGHLRRFQLVFLSLHQPDRDGALRFCGRQLLVPDRSVHRRSRARHSAPHLFALLDDVHARPRPHPQRRARHAPVHPGHGHQGRRQDVEVARQRRFARRHGGALRRRCHAPLHALCRAARPRPRLAGSGRRRREPLPQPGSTASSPRLR